MEMTKFLQAQDPIFKHPILSFPLTAVDRLYLQANIAKAYAIPSNTDKFLFSSTESIYVIFGNSNVADSLSLDEYDNDILDGSACMLDPGVICNVSFEDFTHVGLISGYACNVFIQRWGRI